MKSEADLLVAGGVERHTEIANRVMALGEQYGINTGLKIVTLDEYEPMPEGYDLPELTLDGGARLGGHALSLALQDGTLEAHYKELSNS